MSCTTTTYGNLLWWGVQGGGGELLSPHIVYCDVEDTDVYLTIQMTHIIMVLADRSHATELCLHH
jgi:hypothetical protein